jgi:dienelactone hydrolase
LRLSRGAKRGDDDAGTGHHAFNNDTSVARYGKKAIDLAWGRTVAFPHEYLP